MEKTHYFAPETEEIKIGLLSVICDSIIIPGGSGEGGSEGSDVIDG